MKKLIALSLLCLFMASISLAKITLPRADDITLDNGLTIRVIERHNLPLFSMQITFRAGSIEDPPGKGGLANLCNDMLMRGTANRTAKQIAEDIAFGGGVLRNFCGREGAGFSGEFLSANGEQGIAIFADVLIDSRFANDELEKTKTRTIANLQGDLDNPSSIATSEFYGALLGDSPYAHRPLGTVGTVPNLTRREVTDFYAGHYTPDNCIMIVCGDIDKATIKAWAEKYLSSWSGKTSVSTGKNGFNAVQGPSVLLYDKQDATQSQIRIGNMGIARSNPDYIPLEAARTIYAGSFTSRLVNEIRVNRGLSYGVRCYSNQYKPGGVVYVSTFTKNESVGEVIDIILNESRRMHTEAVPDSELAGAINYRNGLYPLRFETNDDIADIYSDLWLYDLDKSYYEDFQDKMKTVSPKQLMKMARKYFPLDDYQLVVVGKADDIKDQLAKYGPVTIVPLTAQ